jgi:hypothetical protein
VGRLPTHALIAISLGNGRTVEAASENWGVGTFSATVNRTWTHTALIPNDYSSNIPPSDDPDQEEVVTDQLVYYAGSDGAVHPYLVNGVTTSRTMRRDYRTRRSSLLALVGPEQTTQNCPCDSCHRHKYGRCDRFVV